MKTKQFFNVEEVIPSCDSWVLCILKESFSQKQIYQSSFFSHGKFFAGNEKNSPELGYISENISGDVIWEWKVVEWTFEKFDRKKKKKYN